MFSGRLGTANPSKSSSLWFSNTYSVSSLQLDYQELELFLRDIVEWEIILSQRWTVCKWVVYINVKEWLCLEREFLFILIGRYIFLKPAFIHTFWTPAFLDWNLFYAVREIVDFKITKLSNKSNFFSPFKSTILSKYYCVSSSFCWLKNWWTLRLLYSQLTSKT